MSATVSVIIPIYNEAGQIEETVRAVMAHMNGKPYAFELILVDDGSSDRTPIRLLELKAQYACIVCTHEKNRGKGAAVQTGVAASNGEYVLFMDADHSVSIEYIDEFLEYMQNGYEIVIASIGVPGARIYDVHPKLRRTAALFAKQLIRATAVPGIADTQRGFKLFKRSAAKDLFGTLRTMRWGFDIEILARAQSRKLAIAEVPVSWNNRKISSIGFSDYMRTLGELALIIMRRNLDP